MNLAVYGLALTAAGALGVPAVVLAVEWHQAARRLAA